MSSITASCERRRARAARRLNALTAALCAAGLASPALHAAPQGGEVRAGDVRIGQQGAVTLVEQSSNRAVIDWRSFDIGASEAVRFQQPSSQSATLNRVTGGQLSQIDGQLNANGQVFLVNPNGVIFGKGARIDVGGLFVTTSNIADPDFMAGKLEFNQPGQPGARIVNAGTITAAEGGLVALVAPHVQNDGVIAARLGKVTLAGGERFTLDLYGDQLIRLAIPDADAEALLAAQGGRVDHTGSIEADGGKVVLITAASGKQALDGVINLDGVIRADTVREQGGRIVLESSGSLNIGGELLARGDDAGERGGSVDARGDRVAVGGGASVNVSGQAGGGTLHLGGAWQSQGEGMRARELAVDADSRLAADALQSGDGGEVVLWSDGHTRYAGSISARGGATGGNGGRVEVSGRGQLDFAGDVDAGASAGQGGMLLLDPENLRIGADEAAVISRVLRTGTSTKLQASEDIDVDAAIDGRGLNDGGGLTLEAGSDIRVNDFIVTQNGAVDLIAGSGTVDVATGKAVFAGNAPIRVSAGGDLFAGTLLTSGALSLTSTGGAVRIAAPVEAGNGDLIVRAHGDVDIDAPVVNLRAGSDVDVEAGGSIRVSAQIDGIDGASGGTVRLAAGDDLTLSHFVATNDGAVSVTAGGGITVGTEGGVVSGSGPLNVTAGGDVAAGGILSSTTAVDVRSQGGSVVLDAPFTADTGALTVNAAVDVRVNQPVVSLRSGAPVTMNAGRDLFLNAPMDGSEGAAGGSVSLSAGRNLQVEESIATHDGDITLSAGAKLGMDPAAGLYSGSGTIALAGATVQSGILSSSGDISVTARNGNLTSAGTVVGGGTIRMDASGNLVVNQAIGVGGSLLLDAGSDLTVNALLRGNGSGSLGLEAGHDVVLGANLVTDSGAIGINAGNSVRWGSGIGLYSGSGAITVTSPATLTTGVVMSGGPISLRSTSGSVNLGGQLQGGSGAITVGAAQNVVVSRPVVFGNGGSLLLQAGGSVDVNALVRGGSGANLRVTAGDSVRLGNDLVIGGGLLQVSAGNTVDFGSAGMFAGSGALVVGAGGDLTSGHIQAGGGATLSSGGNLRLAEGVDSSVGSLMLTATGDIDIDAAIGGVAGGVTATAGNDLRVNAQIDGIGTGIALNAVGDVSINADVASADAPISVAAGGTVVQAANGTDEFGAPLTRQLRAGDAPISVSAGGDLVTGSLVTTSTLDVVAGGKVTIAVPVYETTGDTRIVAGGGIEVNQVLANATSGADLALEAGGDIDVNAKIGPWDRSDNTYPVINRDAVAGGRVSLTAGGDINIGAEIATYRDTLTGADDASITLTSTGGTVNLAAGLNVSSDGGAIAVTAHGDLVNGVAPANVNDDPTGYMTTGAISLTSTAGDVIIDQTIPDTTGSVTITAADGVTINQRIYTDDGDIRIVAGAGGIWQNPAADPEPVAEQSTFVVSDIDARNGNVYLEAVGAIEPTIVRTNANLTIKSTGGSIIGGKVELSRDGSAAPIGMPDLVELAGHTGIVGFNTAGSPNVAAISDAGSISGLIYYLPASLLVVAAEDIIDPAHTVGSNARFHAGRDFQIDRMYGGALEARAGRNLSIAHDIIGSSLQVSAGLDPFSGLGGVTIAGVAVPTWGGPLGTGNISIGTPAEQITMLGIGGLTAEATGNVTLPLVHVSYSLETEADSLSPLHQQQPFSVTAGGDITVERAQTMGSVSMVSTGGDININYTLAPHVAVLPAGPGVWNPNDLGVASIDLRADTGDINMHEARAEGDITIAAPSGQVNFIGGLNGVEAGGTRSVTDSDGVVVSDSIDPTEVVRLPIPAFVAPAIAVGPTMAGTLGGPQPGALPPGAPSAPVIAGASPGAAPGAPAAAGGSVSTGGPSAVTVASSAPGAAGAGSSSVPGGGGDDFGEVFVADDAAEQPAQRGPDGKQEETGDETKLADTGADDGAKTGDDGQDTEAAPEDAPALAAAETTDEEEEEKRKRARKQAEAATTAYLVFAGGRGDTKEKDFGRDEPVAYGRVRP